MGPVCRHLPFDSRAPVQRIRVVGFPTVSQSPRGEASTALAARVGNRASPRPGWLASKHPRYRAPRCPRCFWPRKWHGVKTEKPPSACGRIGGFSPFLVPPFGRGKENRLVQRPQERWAEVFLMSSNVSTSRCWILRPWSPTRRTSSPPFRAAATAGKRASARTMSRLPMGRRLLSSVSSRMGCSMDKHQPGGESHLGIRAHSVPPC